MSEDLSDQKHHLAIRDDMKRAAAEPLGVRTIEYLGISFRVSRRFVIADVSPLAFFNLIESIENEGIDAAVTRLHNWVLPLLTCRHQWTGLRRQSDEHVRGLKSEWLEENASLYICKACTAYALGTSLPKVGRLLEDDPQATEQPS